MRRLFWLVAGITVGVLVFRKLQQTAEKLTATSVGNSLGSALSQLADQAGEFLADVRLSMREQEDRLREGAGLDSEPAAAAVPERRAEPTA
jgi:hypothetical protein